MIVMGYHRGQDDIGWRAMFRSVILFVRKFKLTANSKASTAPSWEEDPDLQKAILTFRMAANPGEDYEVVAARIEQEAARYREFLRNPQPIRCIILNVKSLVAEEDECLYTREQYWVRDPAQGLASMNYTFARSNKLVLEFIAYDEQNNALFPIVRTYSTWLGKKKFKLGLGRTFYLSMFECDSPDQVVVQAGFMPFARERVLSPARAAAAAAGPPPLTAYTENGTSDIGFTTTAFSPSYGRGLALAMGMQCLVVPLLCCMAFWWVFGRSATPVEVSKAMQPSGASDVSRTAPEETPPDAYTAGVLPATVKPAKEGRPARPTATRDKNDRLKLKTVELQKAARLVEINRISVVVDGTSCHDTEDRCDRLLANFQKAIETDLNRLKLPVNTTDENDSGDAVKLVVSYKPVNDCFGHVYVTLYDQKGLLWGEEDDCLEYGEGQADDFVRVASEKMSVRLANELTQARALIDAEGKKDTNTTNKIAE